MAVTPPRPPFQSGQAVTRAAQLAQRLPTAPPATLQAALQSAQATRLRIPAHYLSLIQAPGDPFWLQAVPSPEELAQTGQEADPLAEDHPDHAPVANLTHRYPDRALLLVTRLCPLYCRFCMRRRKTLRGPALDFSGVKAGLEALAQRPQVKEVILSGGDPLMLPPARLEWVLGRLSRLPHLRRLRIHTRVACAEPERITPRLARLLAAPADRGLPLFLALHFNHPDEVTPQAAQAIGLLRRQGLPLFSQTVLLKEVNDHPETLLALYGRLMALGVQPYYLHHPDLIPGTAHFRLSVERGAAIVSQLRRLAPQLSGLHHVLDTPGGYGKVALSTPLPPPA